jgi:hypothetical protein
MTMRRKKIKAGDYISISLSKTIEPDVISWLNGQENLSKSINVLIRKEVFGSTKGVSGQKFILQFPVKFLPYQYCNYCHNLT